MATPKSNVSDPGIFGRRLLPQVLDDFASKEPERECFSIPRSSDPKDGWRPVSFKEYANAVNRVARIITLTCGAPAAGAFPTIAYVGPNDARYVILILAAVKAGYKALFVSPRNSLEGQLSLFEATDCHIVMFPSSHRKMVEPWLQAREMKPVEIEPLESWLLEEEVPHVSYLKTFEEAEWDPLCVLHTSGSTGIPSPIVARHGMLAIADKHQVITDRKGRSNFLNALCGGITRNYLPMPLFHAAGIYTFMSIALYRGTPFALGIPDRPLTPDSVIKCLEHVDVQTVLLPPAILEDMSQNDDFAKALAKYEWVMYAGGNISTEAGNRLVDHGVRLHSVISSTECYPFAIFMQPDPKLWQYFVIDTEEPGLEFRQVDNDDVYRLVCLRTDKSAGFQGFFYTFPDKNEFDTKDLYKPHPTLPDHWTYAGRSDNIIVFSNGEKLNPVTIEDIVSHHPEVNGVLVAGSGRFQPCLLLEAVKQPETEDEVKELIDRVWPFIATANEQTVAHGQIAREFIIVAPPEKPFLRAGKGTIQRAGTLNLYEDEMNELYEKAGESSSLEAPELDLSSKETLTKSIQSLFRTRVGFKGELESEADFFSSGVDSIQVISLARLLRAGLEAAGYAGDAGFIAAPAIYSNPTSQRLAGFILSHINGNGVTPEQNNEAHEIERMEALWKKYTGSLLEANLSRPDPSDEGQTVVLTGSTGTLGSYMLDQMIKNPAVKRVVCLNRAEDGGKKRQAQGMRERDLATDHESKCTFLHADMSRSDFGLPQEAYNELLETADRFIHNAWPVNFNIPVESFEPHIRSVRNVADFASKSSKRVAVVFISSISTGEYWDPKAGLLPEARLEDLSVPAGGYGRSKAVSSLILEDVARAAGFPAAIIRVGQIGGPEAEAGFWSKQEWFPSIVASSLYLGALPKDLGSMNRVDWTPIEKIAGLVLDVAGVSQKVPADKISGYYHGVNPSATPWDELAPAVQEFYGKERIAELVDFNEWVARLDKSQHGDIKALEKNPGVKLLDTYRAMASGGVENQTIFDMTHTTERSPSMRNATPVTRELLMHWCQQWKF